jgi:hypothetical protein
MTLTYPIVLLLVGVACAAAYALGRWSAARKPRQTLPREWAVIPRPVLNDNERRTLRLLREAMPEHTVLAKLPLIRLCQARDPQRVRYWYDLLAPLHVSFAVCSANGRVLVAIDLESERGMSRRAAAIKRAVMDACRIRYLSCHPDDLPSAGELQLLLPQRGSSMRSVPLTPAPNFQQARSTLSDTVRSRRAERSQRWSDSSYQNDSFFAPDSRMDAPPSEFGPYGEPPPREPRSAGGR